MLLIWNLNRRIEGYAMAVNLGDVRGEYTMDTQKEQERLLAPLRPAEQRELVTYLRHTLPLELIRQQHQRYLADGEIALAKELEEIIRSRSPLPEGEGLLWTTGGQALAPDAWWARRWGIVVSGTRLQAKPHPEIRSLIEAKTIDPDDLLSTVTFANQRDAESVIAAIETYCARRY